MQRIATYKLAVLAVCGAVLTNVGTTIGHSRDPQAEPALAAAYVGGALPVGSPHATEAISAIVARAAEVPNSAGQYLLPADTCVDDVRWDGNVVEIDLTMPAVVDRSEAGPTGWYLTPVDLETISQALGRPFADDPAFGGTWIRVRVGPDRPYGTLDQLTLDQPGAPSDKTGALAETPVPSLAPQPRVSEHAPEERGPIANAARQPVGALTGVTVFVAAGHGWTAGSSSWALQRPILWEMAEDYGNVDQLNYFVHYAFNAGATVVPFRPVGWQPIEIVLDQDDPGVTYTGTWSNGSSSKYYENWVTNSGVPYRWASASTTETATARYTPNITVTDFYPVYGFTIANTNRTLQTYRVRHSGGITAVAVDHRLVGNGWIWLGAYYFEAGGDNYVEITNESPEAGVVIADAIRWGDGLGDVVRPGPGHVSGYPRDEEAQRYWAESELGNYAIGFDPSIWDIDGYDDLNDNVRCAAKWAREMNQEPPGGVLVDRWKRIYLEFHSNASDGNARGQMCLITDLGATTYQTQYATILSNEIDADLPILDDEFEHPWYDRPYPTYTGSYGAICTEANGDEFDATIVELAFHDNQLDAELLRDSRVRSYMARACVHGMIRFLNTLPGSQVPLAFLPDTPRDVRVEDTGNGNVVISWQPPLADAARGDPATGYVVYQSANGYGFGNPILLDNVLSTTITDVPVGQIRYFRAAATNAGGQSMPSEVLAIRRPAQGAASVLIVNGFDRLRRQINPVQTFTQPPAYAGQYIERPIWWQSNSYDYVVQYAEALAANDFGFASCSNEAVSDSYVQLSNYAVAVWILGTESTEDATFSATEQNIVTAFLNNGGALFVTGADIASDLIDQGHGVSFAQEVLRFDYQADDAGTFEVAGAAGGILGDLGSFNFDPASGAPYEVRSPDVLLARSGAKACLNYVGGSGGAGGVQYTTTVYNVVTFGFPFETISSPTVRAQVMQRVIDFLLTANGPLPFDYDNDGDVDMQDFNVFAYCFHGPGYTYPNGHLCLKEDGDGDQDVDLADFSVLQQYFTGSGQP